MYANKRTNLKLVTIGLPIWKRLEYLPHVLKIIEAQDYPSIELIVSDNGMNGTKVRDAVQAHYSRPFRFRQNSSTVEIANHFNQIVQEATGEYFILLSDDDEISSNFVSDLVRLLDSYPEASLAFASQEIMHEDGVVMRKSNDFPAQVLSGAQFIRGLWQSFEFRFETTTTFVARTAEVRACGGYPDFAHGNGIDNALIIKLCLDSKVALNPECVFRWRVHESGLGWSVSPRDLAAALIEFMQFLDSDPVIRKLGTIRPAEWRELKNALVKNQYQTYFFRWRDIYKSRLSRLQWVRAAFEMPFLPWYYRNVARVIRKEARGQLLRLFGFTDPATEEPDYFARGR